MNSMSFPRGVFSIHTIVVSVVALVIIAVVTTVVDVRWRPVGGQPGP